MLYRVRLLTGVIFKYSLETTICVQIFSPVNFRDQYDAPLRRTGKHVKNAGKRYGFKCQYVNITGKKLCGLTGIICAQV